MRAIQPCALLREPVGTGTRSGNGNETALGRRAGRKNAESGWEVICDERASGELMESSGNSGAKYKARNYGREELADASWLGYC